MNITLIFATLGVLFLEPAIDGDWLFESLCGTDIDRDVDAPVLLLKARYWCRCFCFCSNRFSVKTTYKGNSCTIVTTSSFDKFFSMFLIKINNIKYFFYKKIIFSLSVSLILKSVSFCLSLIFRKSENRYFPKAHTFFSKRYNYRNR